MKEEKFLRQMNFLIEADKMKSIYRQTYLANGERQETDAEHSWHFALMAMVLYEYADQDKVDLDRVIKMALVHDLVEIYAGDTYAYDEKENVKKEEREKLAADKLFVLLPEEQGNAYRKLWEEFDAAETPDAVFASAVDRLQPFINGYLTKGRMWQKHGVKSEQIKARIKTIEKGMPDIYPYAVKMLEDAVKKGYLKE